MEDFARSELDHMFQNPAREERYTLPSHDHSYFGISFPGPSETPSPRPEAGSIVPTQPISLVETLRERHAERILGETSSGFVFAAPKGKRTEPLTARTFASLRCHARPTRFVWTRAERSDGPFDIQTLGKGPGANLSAHVMTRKLRLSQAPPGPPKVLSEEVAESTASATAGMPIHPYRDRSPTGGALSRTRRSGEQDSKYRLIHQPFV